MNQEMTLDKKKLVSKPLIWIITWFVEIANNFFFIFLLSKPIVADTFCRYTNLNLKTTTIIGLHNIPFTISSPTNVVTHLFKSDFTLKCFNSTYVMSWLFSVELVNVCAWWLVFIFLSVEVVSSRVICCMLITFHL